MLDKEKMRELIYADVAKNYPDDAKATKSIVEAYIEGIERLLALPGVKEHIYESIEYSWNW